MSVYKGDKLVAGSGLTAEYVRNQNILSDWEDITISTNEAAPTVMPYDGFITVPTQPYDDNYIFVNGARIQETVSSASIAGNRVIVSVSLLCPVKKGDNVYVKHNGPGFKGTTSKACFYKLRDYTGR